MVTRDVLVTEFLFAGTQSYTTSAGQLGLIATTKVGSGTPTLLHVSDETGAVAVTLSNTSEAQSQGLSYGDILSWRLDQIIAMEWQAKVSGIDAVSTVNMGLASAYNATPDSVTTNVWFKIDGTVSTSNIVTETDDNTTDTDDIATGVTLSSTYKKFQLDFSAGLGNVKFKIDGASVSTAQTFNMSALSAGTKVQPYFFVAKASGTGVPALTIARPCRVIYRAAAGA